MYYLRNIHIKIKTKIKQSYIISFKANSPLVPEKKMFLKILNIYGPGSHVGHVSWTV